MLPKSKAVFLWHKKPLYITYITLYNLWFMRPNMKSLKASDLQGVTIEINRYGKMMKVWAELSWNLLNCSGNNRDVPLNQFHRFLVLLSTLTYHKEVYPPQCYLMNELNVCLVDDVFYKLPSPGVKRTLQKLSFHSLPLLTEKSLKIRYQSTQKQK